MSIFTEYSLWYLPLCVAVGVLASFILYKNATQFREAPRFVRVSMFVLRAAVVSLLCLLLLGIFTNRSKTTIEKPLIVLLQDDSESVAITKDSAYYRNEYPKQMQSLLKKLSKQYDVETFSFGKHVLPGVSYSYSQKETNISRAIEDISVRFYSRNVGAVILASDGIYTSGKNPVYSVQNLPFSSVLHTIVLGDTVQSQDAIVQDAVTNKIVFRDVPFPIKVSIRAYFLAGKTTTLRVFHESKQVFSQPLRITSNDFYYEQQCLVSSLELGKQIFTVVLDSVDTEFTTRNNTTHCIVDVLESRQKIAIFYTHIHPDISAVKRAIEENQNYSVELFQMSDFLGTIDDYSCVIFHGLPQSDRASQLLVEKAFQKKIPAFFMYAPGMHSHFAKNYGCAVTFPYNQTMFDEVSGEVDNAFTAFQIRKEIQELISFAPPVHAPYGTYTLQAAADVAVWQQLQAITLSRPLLAFQEIDGIKYATFMAEGLWRWRFYADRTYGETRVFDEFIHTIISYIALRETRSPFEVFTRDIFEETEPVMFSAELYDETFTPVVSESVYMSIQDSAKKEYTYTFTPLERSYMLDIGMFPPGKYSYTAHCVYNKKDHKQTGVFLVQSLQKEFLNTKADVSLMRTLAHERNGAVFFPTTMEAIVDSIQHNENITPISHTVWKQTNILDYILLLILLVVFVTAEWFLRKYYGGV